MKTFVRRIYLLGVLFVLLVGLNTFLGHHRLESQLRREMERSISFKLAHITDLVSADLARVEGALYSAKITVERVEDDQEILHAFRQILKENESFLALYLGTPAKEVIYAEEWTPPADFDVTKRPWYEEAVRQQKLIFTAPYLDVAEDRLVITMARPVYDAHGELLAVVGIDKSLEGMLDLLEKEKASEYGHSFFFTKDGEIMMCPCPDYGLTEQRNLAEISDLQDPALWGQPTGLVYTNMHGREGYFRWQILDELELIVGTFAPFSDFIDRQALNLQLLTTLLVLSVVIFYLLFIMQRQNIIGPLKELDHDIMAISPDYLSYRLPVQKHHNFGPLRETINLILQKNQEHFENIIHQREELSAAYEQLVVHEQQLQAQYKKIKKHETQIQFLADHDPLTGLLNRRKFVENMESNLSRNQQGTIFMVDVDDFKNINDTQGHVFGDQVLRFVAGFFQKKLGHKVTAYRFGGDEFLLLVPGEINKQIIEELFTKILSGLETSEIKGRRIHLAISAGVVRFPHNGTTVDELLIKADIALHNAKGGAKPVLSFLKRAWLALLVPELKRNACYWRPWKGITSVCFINL